MSLDATTWARHQQVGKGPAKAVLMALCDYANEQFIAYPSVDALIGWTEQDRKTVLVNLDRLKEAGWISDTGERTGRTRQVVVYQINLERGVEVKIGQSQKRNSSKNGTVPNLTGKSPKSDVKQSQIHTETVPKTGHGTISNSSEQERNDQSARLAPHASVQGDEAKSKGKTAEPDTVTLQALVAEGIARQHAKDWLTARKKKSLALTPTAWDGVKAEAKKAGLTPALAVEQAAKRGWAGFRASWLTDGKQATAGAAPDNEADWDRSMEGIKRRAEQLGVKPQRQGEDFVFFKARVFKAVGPGPWIDRLLFEWRGTESVHTHLVAYFNDARAETAAT